VLPQRLPARHSMYYRYVSLQPICRFICVMLLLLSATITYWQQLWAVFVDSHVMGA